MLTLKFDLRVKNVNFGSYLMMVAARRAPLSSDNSYYTVSVRWKHTDRTLAERPELATNTQRARREIDTFCVHLLQRIVDVPSAYAYRAADARNIRIACA